jgi:hypothetical protein
MAFGIYHRYGYEIYLDGADTNGDGPCYTGGNAPWESTTVVPAAEGLPLATIALYCESTGKEIAQEQGEQWHGCEHDRDTEDHYAEMVH